MLTGKQIYLRPLEEGDLSLRVKWVNTPEIHEMLMFDYPLSLTRTKQWFLKSLSDNSKVHFSIVDSKTHRTVGMTGLIQIDMRHQRAQFYITIGEKEYWGRHIADECIAIVVRYGFLELNLNKVYLYTLARNTRARAVYERNGFKPEAVMREHFYSCGEFQDLHQHGILRTEWIGIRRRTSRRRKS